MSLDQLKGTEITIKKGEWITQAIDRVAKEKNIEITKSELLDLAVQVSKDVQFKWRKITQYSVWGKKYDAVSLVHAGEKFKIQWNAPVVKPAVPVSAPPVSVPASVPAVVAPVVKPAASSPTVVNKPASVPATPASAAPVTPAPVVAPAAQVKPAPAPVAAPVAAPAAKPTLRPQQSWATGND